MGAQWRFGISTVGLQVAIELNQETMFLIFDPGFVRGLENLECA